VKCNVRVWLVARARGGALSDARYPRRAWCDANNKLLYEDKVEALMRFLFSSFLEDSKWLDRRWNRPTTLTGETSDRLQGLRLGFTWHFDPLPSLASTVVQCAGTYYPLPPWIKGKLWDLRVISQGIPPISYWFYSPNRPLEPSTNTFTFTINQILTCASSQTRASNHFKNCW